MLGHGAAGLLCAARLASDGMKVAVAGAGQTSTSLSTGCITTLHPASEGVIDRGRLCATFPYTLAGGGWDQICAVLEDLFSFLIPELDARSLPLRGDPFTSRRLLSYIGTGYQCSIPQMHSIMGGIDDLRERPVSLLGIMGHRDSDPDLASAMARELGLSLHPYWTRPSTLGVRTDLVASEIARMAGKREILEELVEALSDVPEEVVGLPPILDLGSYNDGMRYMREGSGREIFEMITPLSLPGMRLQNAMESMTRERGARMLLGWRGHNLSITDNEAESVTIVSRSREMKVSFTSLVLAMGDTVGGGVEVRGQSFFPLLLPTADEGGGVREVSPLELVEMSKMGSEVDLEMRPIIGGEPLRNVFLAGSMISGFSYPGGTGLTATMLTAWLAANSVKEESP